jgi:hypothetical protein
MKQKKAGPADILAKKHSKAFQYIKTFIVCKYL